MGKVAIRLGVGEEANHVTIVDKAGRPAIAIAALEEGNHIAIFDKAGNIEWSAP